MKRLAKPWKKSERPLDFDSQVTVEPIGSDT